MSRGFTLIELLVALLIFAMLSAAGVMLLSGTVSAQGAVTARLDDMAAIERASSLMTADLAQALPRISRTQNGKLAPAFYAEATIGPERPALLLVRGGWDNLDGNADRPTIQKVEYWLVDGRLERRSHPYVDGTAATDATPLIEGITSARLRFRDASGAWRKDWAAVQPDLLPSAVELTFSRRGAPLRLLFLVGPGAAPENDDD
ncbi:MAG TPA: type II secretion system minor pseudopilin GspJ [Sphingomonas sp.]|nr:type II secretion system minor pseudopilin GspJ [Sphingomonas sp.]